MASFLRANVSFISFSLHTEQTISSAGAAVRSMSAPHFIAYQRVGNLIYIHTHISFLSDNTQKCQGLFHRLDVSASNRSCYTNLSAPSHYRPFTLLVFFTRTTKQLPTCLMYISLIILVKHRNKRTARHELP